jgi:hypothetical protein
MDQRYDIVFNGELLPGFAPAQVADNLGRLFKATPETVARLLGGGSHVLKRGADADTAQKYAAAMQRAGARAQLRPVADAPGTEAPAPATAPSPPAPAVSAPVPAPAEVSLALAPAGGELLAAHERRVVEPVVVETRHIKLVSTFMAPPEPERAPPPPPPDTSHISVAAAGAELLPERRDEPPPPPPDTSAITLAPAGQTLGPEAPPLAVAVPDTSAITLAPPGAPLEELRPQRAPLDPDTSALQLAPQ